MPTGTVTGYRTADDQLVRGGGQPVGVPDRLAHSPAETAELLGVSRMTVYRLMETGELRSQKIGRSRRILRSSIDEMLGGDHVVTS